MKTVFRLLALTVLLFVATPGAAGASELVIESANGRTHHFTVEVADDERARSVGLMLRDTLPPDNGMLFDFKVVQPVAMWMKNTLISLDMLFLADDGRVVFIAERTVPHSLTPLGPPKPVRAVLEINGGQASRLGIAVGDQVRHSLFGR